MGQGDAHPDQLAMTVRMCRFLPPFLKTNISKTFSARVFMLPVGLLIVFLLQGELPAQDRVTYVPDGTAGSVTIIGEVVDYTGKQLIMRTINGTQHLSSVSVSGIETRYDPLYLQALQDFQNGKTEAAQTAFRDAVKKEPRLWVQREIHSRLMQCALRLQDLSGGLREFREILQTDPQTRHWGIAPLVWSPLAVSQGIRNDAQQWLTSPREGERLLAASLLLLDPVHGDAAEECLNLLARDPNPILSDYSKAQLWRLVIASQRVSDETLVNWRSDINRLRPELRNGPQYLLARGYEVRGELRTAAAEALWLPGVYMENEPLAARALLDAAEWLQRSGLNIESQTLHQELLVRYPWSQEASMVRSQSQQRLAP